MNFIDYIIKKTDKYTKMGLNNPETKEYLLTLQVLNYRARCMKEKFNKNLEIDTELDKGHFERKIVPISYFFDYKNFEDKDKESK